MKKQVNCYDRVHETSQFISSNKQCYAFINSEGNGITTFLLNKLYQKHYLFIKEYNNDAIICNNDDTTGFFIDTRDENARQNKKNLIEANCYLSFIKEIPLGCCLADSIETKINQQIELCEENRISVLKLIYDYLSLPHKDTFYIIIDKADDVTAPFLRKLIRLVEHPNVKIIFTFTAPAIPAHYQEILSSDLCEIINFSKPIYKNATMIFRNLNYDENYYDETMYEESSCIKDFIKKYATAYMNNSKTNEDVYILYFMGQFNCGINLNTIKLIWQYCVNNALMNNSDDFDNIVNAFKNNNLLYEQNNLYHVNILKSEINPIPNEILIGCVTFLLNNYHSINLDMKLSLYNSYHENFNEDMVTDLICQLYDIDNLIKICKSLHAINEYDNFRKIYAHLYNQRIFIDLPKLNDIKNNEEYRVLKLLWAEKQHKKTSYHKIVKLVKENLNKDIDKATLYAIILLDYCINHKKRIVQSFFDKNFFAYEQKFSKSKHYYLLQNILAFYCETVEKAIQYYNASIEKDNKNIEYLYNNKFAYLLKNYIIDKQYNPELDEISNTLIQNYNALNNNFLTANLELYNSLKKEQNCFNLNFTNNLMTWDIFRHINSILVNYYNNGEFDLNAYKKLEQDVTISNRVSTYLLYYYNLFLFATLTEDYGLKRYSQLKLKKYRINQSNLYKKYSELIMEKPENILLKKYISFGYIFYRTFDISNLLNL